MNVKLHTPKTLKAGSGIATLKQFLLSLVATTISIVLTFGTAAIIDYNKKEADKREMVMAVLYDFNQTIALLEKADTSLQACSRYQQEIALRPESFDSLRYYFIACATVAQTKFSETTEKIFSSNIETFNTIGNVNFINEVSEFYIQRQVYKEQVVEKLANELKEMPIYSSEKNLFEFDFPDYVLDNKLYLIMMKEIRDKCMKMMDVSEQEMEAFSQQRVTATSDSQEDSLVHTLYDELQAAEAVIEPARKRYQQE